MEIPNSFVQTGLGVVDVLGMCFGLIAPKMFQVVQYYNHFVSVKLCNGYWSHDEN
jgi:hypothetical protein